MGQYLLLLVVALTVAAVVFGVTVLVTGDDPGLVPAEPAGQAVPLPGGRPLLESDVGQARFDTALRGYRMAQVDQAMRRAAYDIGYKTELIGVLEAEVTALREGRTADADALRQARESAVASAPAGDQPEAVAAELSGAAPADGPGPDSSVAGARPADPVPNEPASGASPTTPEAGDTTPESAQAALDPAVTGEGQPDEVRRPGAVAGSEPA